MRAIAFLFVFLFLISVVSAVCTEGQIDINTAPVEELDKIVHVGDVRADEIIKLREEKLFESVDDLTRVSGFNGEGKLLSAIKAQGLACVNGIEEESVSDNENETQIQTIQTSQTNTSSTKPESQSQSEQRETINLNPQVIKTEENRNLNNYALYGFMAFVILLGFLFLIRKNRYKNEFR